MNRYNLIGQFLQYTCRSATTMNNILSSLHVMPYSRELEENVWTKESVNFWCGGFITMLGCMVANNSWQLYIAHACIYSTDLVTRRSEQKWLNMKTVICITVLLMFVATACAATCSNYGRETVCNLAATKDVWLEGGNKNSSYCWKASTISKKRFLIQFEDIYRRPADTFSGLKCICVCSQG